MSSLGGVGQTSPRRGALADGLGRLAQTGHDLAGGLGRTSPRPGELAGEVGKLALANGGQKGLLSARSAACFGELLRPKTDRGGHTRTQPRCSGRLVAVVRQMNWRRTADKGGQMETGTAG
jgi:hypothetical protein